MTYNRIILKFLDHICVKFGICLPHSICNEIAMLKYDSPEQFVNIVFEREGIDLSYEVKLYNELRSEFREFSAKWNTIEYDE